MKIVVLDVHTLKPEELDWSGLHGLGECIFHARTTPDQLRVRAAAAEVLLTNKTVLNQAALAALPGLRYIGVTATGTNVVDLVAARARNIPVTNVPSYSTASVAQATLGLLLNLAHQVSHHAESVRAGNWARSPDWCYWEKPLVELAGRTLGIVGFGAIGREVARLAQAFGMKLLVTTRTPREFPDYVRPVPLDQLLAESDVVSLHCPLSDDTRQMINSARLARMKRAAFLLNTSRGGLVDENALAVALNSGQLAGAGLDVLSVEPPPANHPLVAARNCLITPHLAWGTLAARQRLVTTVVGNLRAFLAGQPQNVVN
jgi:glycerate dehydrogenase